MTIDLLDLMAKMKWISWLIQNVSYTPTTYRDTRFVQGGADQQTKGLARNKTDSVTSSVYTSIPNEWNYQACAINKGL